MNFEPIGYEELSYDKIKKYEFTAALLLKPYLDRIKKGMRTADSVIKFLSIWLIFFKDKVVKTRQIDAKALSKNVNTDIRGFLVDLGILQKVSKGYYKLTPSVWETAQGILQHLSKYPYAPNDKSRLKKSNEGKEEVSDNGEKEN